MNNQKHILLLSIFLLALATIVSVSGVFTSKPFLASLPAPRTQLAALDGAGSGLVGWWKFDEGSGTNAADSSGSGNNGTLMPTANPPTWTTGQISNALSVDGATQYMTIPSASSGSLDFGTNSFTISVWVKANSLASTAGIINKGSSPNSKGVGYEIMLDAQGKVWLFLGDGTNGNKYLINNSSAFNLTTGRWYHIVAEAIYNGTSWGGSKLYINGAVLMAVSNSLDQVTGSVTASSNSFDIGRRHGNFGYFNGSIDDVRVYNRTLSSPEVLAIYNQGQNGGAPIPPNVAPTVSAGNDQTITLPATASLVGTASDDGYPQGSRLTTIWSMVSGPGTVTFQNSNALTTSATFSAPGTYVLRLTASDTELNSTSDITITANSSADTVPPVISNVAHSNILETSAMISWITDEPADSQIEYGLTTSYGNTTTLNTNQSTAHSQTLLGLTSGSTYHYRVVSKDISNNIARSSDYSFSTLAQSSSQDLTFTVNDKGIRTLVYKNTSFIDSDAPTLLGGLNAAINFKLPDGTIVAGDTTVVSKTLDQDQKGTTISYIWGSIHLRYEAVGNKLFITSTISNITNNTIDLIVIKPMNITFPSAPSEYNGSSGLLRANMGNPSIIQMSYAGGSMVLANEDVSKPLMIGYPWSNNSPTNTQFTLYINTGKYGSYSSNLLNIVRPIAPQSSDTYQLSLRFGDSSMSVTDLAGDIISRFNQLYPFKLNWPDRRAIGTEFLSARQWVSAVNPRGWISASKDYVSTIGTTTGQQRLHNDMMARFNTEIQNLRYLNAQGIIFWDIESASLPISYVGSPDKLPVLAPEMDALADEIFAAFRNAGFRVGVTVRPDRFYTGTALPSSCSDGQIFVDTDAPIGQQTYICQLGAWSLTSSNQQVVTDYKDDLIRKIAYAHNRWNATLFYIDSYKTYMPQGFEVLDDIMRLYPDILLIPESGPYAPENIGNASYYSLSIPYWSINNDARCCSTLADITRVYSGAVNAITISGIASHQEHFNELVASVRRGTILNVGSWYISNAQQFVKQIYDAAGVVAPPPTPIPGSCSTTVNSCTSGTFSDVTDTSTNYLWSCLGSNGGSTASCSLPISTSQPDTTAPVISITSPSNNSTISGTVNLSASASDPTVSNQTTSGISSIQFRLDGSSIGSALTTAPYSGSWNTIGISNGNHVITALARDVAGNTTVSSPVNVNINNTSPYIPPVIPPAGGGNPTNPTSPVGVFTPLVTQRPVTTPIINSYIPTYSPTKPSSNPPTSSNTPTRITRNLKLNDQGTDVLLLQKTLNSLGYTVATPSKYTETTKQAVIQYQTDRMLSKTGILDNTTLFLINIDIANLHNPKAPIATSSDVATDTNVFTIGSIWDKILAFIIYILNMIWKWMGKVAEWL